MNNLIGEDRHEALRVIDDDEAFDQWLIKFAKERNTPGPKKKPRGKSVSKEEFQKRTKGMLPNPSRKDA
jgi:hypothetical protein